MGGDLFYIIVPDRSAPGPPRFCFSRFHSYFESVLCLVSRWEKLNAEITSRTQILSTSLHTAESCGKSVDFVIQSQTYLKDRFNETLIANDDTI